MIEYKLIIDDEGEIVCCDSCHYPAPVSNFQVPAHRRPTDGSEAEDNVFCQFCSSTYVANTYQYPDQHSDRTSAQATAHAFNALVDGLGADRSKMWKEKV